MRDAVVTGLTLNIFNAHSDRITMANVAQMINVLQSVILTKGAEMILTPTYHVFDLYKCHQNATRIESYVQQDLTGVEDALVPALSVSASEDEAGEVHATVTNADADEAKLLNVALEGKAFTSAVIRYVAGDMNAHNDFGGCNEVYIKAMDTIPIIDNHFTVTLPACCVAEITLK